MRFSNRPIHALFKSPLTGVDRLELLDADLGVNGGGFELLATEKLLDDADNS